MPANLAGIPAGITPHQVPVLRQPIGSDPPNAVTFAECFGRTADYVAYLMQNAGDIAAAQTWTALQTFGGGASVNSLHLQSDLLYWTTPIQRRLILGPGDVFLQSGSVEVPHFPTDGSAPVHATFGHGDVAGTCQGYVNAHIPALARLTSIYVLIQNTGSAPGTLSFQAGYRGYASGQATPSWTWASASSSAGVAGRVLNASIPAGFNGINEVFVVPNVPCPENASLEMSFRMVNPADGVLRISLIVATYNQFYIRPAT